MALSNTTKQKCRACGSIYPRDYTPAEHSDREHCDGPLQLYCDTCKTFIPDRVCEACEARAQEAAEAERKREARRREIEQKKKIVQQRIQAAKKSALSSVAKKKCREDGGMWPSDYTDEEHHDNEHCDGPLEFYCQTCNAFQSEPICIACEQRAVEAKQRRLKREAIERRAAEERERLRKEREERLRRALEEEERRQAQFLKATMVSGRVAFAAAILCFMFTLQLFTHGNFIIPYSEAIIYLLLSIALAAGLSVFFIAIFFEVFV